METTLTFGKGIRSDEPMTMMPTFDIDNVNNTGAEID